MEEQQLGTVLWRGRALIALSLVFALAGAFAATALSTKVYQATAILEIGRNSASGPESSLATQQASQSLAKQYASLLGSSSFLARLRTHVRGVPNADALEERVDATALEETGLIELSAEGSSPVAAIRLADSTANGFLELLRSDAARVADQQQAQGIKRIAAIVSELTALGRGGDAEIAAQRAALEAERAAVTEQLATAQARTIAQAVSLAAPPAAADAPVRPRRMLNLLAGILLGLMVGVGLAWLRARLEQGLESAMEAQETLGVPVLGSIPLRRRFSPHDPILEEAFEMLRSNVLFRLEQDGAQAIMFASHRSGEGKTSTVHGLASATARAGKRVLVIDGDLRLRELSVRLGFQSSPGLSSVAAGELALDEAICEVEPGFFLIPAGPPPTNVPALLDSGFMRKLLDELVARYQLILIDSPGTAHLADASILAALSDGVVIVARVGWTQPEDLTSTRVNLGHSRTPILGIVVLEPRSIDHKYFRAHRSAASEVARTPAALR